MAKDFSEAEYFEVLKLRSSGEKCAAIGKRFNVSEKEIVALLKADGWHSGIQKKISGTKRKRKTGRAVAAMN